MQINGYPQAISSTVQYKADQKPGIATRPVVNTNKNTQKTTKQRSRIETFIAGTILAGMAGYFTVISFSHYKKFNKEFLNFAKTYGEEAGKFVKNELKGLSFSNKRENLKDMNAMLNQKISEFKLNYKSLFYGDYYCNQLFDSLDFLNNEKMTRMMQEQILPDDFYDVLYERSKPVKNEEFFKSMYNRHKNNPKRLELFKNLEAREDEDSYNFLQTSDELREKIYGYIKSSYINDEMLARTGIKPAELTDDDITKKVFEENKNEISSIASARRRRSSSDSDDNYWIFDGDFDF